MPAPQPREKAAETAEKSVGSPPVVGTVPASSPDSSPAGFARKSAEENAEASGRPPYPPFPARAGTTPTGRRLRPPYTPSISSGSKVSSATTPNSSVRPMSKPT